MATKTDPKSNSLLLIEENFANQVGKGTGIDPRVILAQTQLEGAYSPGGTGGLNFLNLKASTVSSLHQPYASQSSGGFAQFASLQQAEAATIAEFKSPAIGLTGSNVPPTPRGQIAAIGNSPWDAGHYGGGGANLSTEFGRLFGTQALDQPQSFNTAGFGNIIKAIVTAPAQVFQGTTGKDVNASPTGPNSVLGGLGSLPGLFGLPSSARLGEMIAGGVLVALGIVMIGRSAASGSSAMQVRGAVGAVR